MSARLRIALFASFWLCAPALALASGALDARFGGDGIVTHDLGPDYIDRVNVGLIDAQGRVVGAGGQFTPDFKRGGIVVRLTPTGALDPSFGDGGVARTGIPEATFDNLSWRGLAEYPDGRLLVVGAYSSNAQDLASRAYFCRFLSNGSRDLQFGTEGCTTAQIWPDSSRDVVSALALQPDGRFVVIGETDFDIDSARDYFVARFNEDGSPDRCFGDVTCQSGGVLLEPENDPYLIQFYPYGVAIAPDGRIVVAGRAINQGQADMTVLRLLPTGDIDETFGDGGHRHIGFDQGGFDGDVAEDVVVKPNGHVLVAGWVELGIGRHAGVAALDSNGDLLPGYGDGGRRVFFFNDVSEDQYATAAQLQPDGKLVVTGMAETTDTDADCGVVRLDENGDLDPVFGIDGKVTIDGSLGEEPRPYDECRGLAVRQGAIMVFGASGLTLQTRNSLFVKLDQDDLFRDGFEAVP